MSSKDLLFKIANELNKKPEIMQKFVDILEENFLDEEEQLKEVTDDQWAQMKFPIGIVNKIKGHLSAKAEP